MTLNTNRIIELSLVFFISLFSFSIGTFVGKKYSDNQHRLALLEPNKKTEERAAIDAATATPTAGVTTGESEITDADVAKMAEEFSDTEDTTKTEMGQAEMANAAQMQAHAQAVMASGKTIKTIPAESKDIKEISATEADDTERDIASIPAKARSVSTYTVQVGSYPSEDEAYKMTESLVARGYKANAVPATVNGKTMYRVQVGLFNSLAEAQEYKKELMEKNRLTSAFVQKVAR